MHKMERAALSQYTAWRSPMCSMRFPAALEAKPVSGRGAL